MIFLTKYNETETGKLSEGWKETTIGEIAHISRGASPRPIHEFLSNSGIPWVKISDANSKTNRYIEHTGEFIIEKGRKSTVIVNPGDLIVSNSATPGIPKFMKISAGIHDGWLLIKPNSSIDRGFIYYLFVYERKSLVSFADGTVFKNLKTDIVRAHNVAIPEDISEQKAIAKILSDLDSKIELNNQMNATLEAMAQAIFKHWFIDFEFPNENGKPYKSSGGNMVDSELGKIPEGWHVGKVSDEFNLTMGQSPPGSSYNENADGIAFFQGRTDFNFRFPTVRIFCNAPTRFAEEDDTLVSVRAPVGDINISLEKCCIGRGIAAIRHKSRSSSYTYYVMKNLRNTFENFEAQGTVFGSISKTGFETITILVPPTKMIELFEKTVYSIDSSIKCNTLNMYSLIKVRDSLLPKLMSGKIRVQMVVSK